MVTDDQAQQVPEASRLSKRHAFIISSAVAVAIVLLISAVTGDFFIAQHEARQEVRQLCSVINLVAENPVPEPSNPGANPSRNDLYKFYVAFKTIQHAYGC